MRAGEAATAERTRTRWQKRPQGSNWGDFGNDDQVGRLNLVDAEKVRQGIAEVKEGRTFCLSLPLDYPGGQVLNARRTPPVLRPTEKNGRPNYGYPTSNDVSWATEVVNDDIATLNLQYSTHWDALGHLGYLFDSSGTGKPEVTFYNGYRFDSDFSCSPAIEDTGFPGQGQVCSTCAANALGIENMAERCVQGRAVLIDLHAHFGREHKDIGFDDLSYVLKTDGVVVEPGDMVCIHTGFAQMLMEMKGKPDKALLDRSCTALDGKDKRLLEWVTEVGLSCLIADNRAVETLSGFHGLDAHSAHHPQGASLPLHEHCIFKLGINLGELWYLTELAEFLRSRKRSRFLLTAPPLRLPGAVGSPLTPVATV